MTPTCGNCRFSLPGKNPDGTINFAVRWCRHSPPVPIWMPGKTGPMLQSMWPSLDSNSVCGQHQFPEGSEPLLPGETKLGAETAQ